MRGIKLSTWKRKASKIGTEYKTIDELFEACDKHFGKYYGDLHLGVYKLFIVRPVGLIDDDEYHMSRDSLVFKKIKKKWIKLDTKKLIEELIPKLKDKVSIDSLIRDVLDDSSPDELEEIFERVVTKKGKIQEREGCYKLLLYGKKGSPYELMLRN